jgi:hypothetical protein
MNARIIFGFMVIVSVLHTVCCSVRKCGYPDNTCLCDMEYGTIFCGHNVRNFPVFSSYIKQHTTEIHLIHTEIDGIPVLDGKMWPKMRKLILRNNTKILCNDIFQLKGLENITVISDCILPGVKENEKMENKSTKLSGMYNRSTDEPLMNEYNRNTGESQNNNTVTFEMKNMVTTGMVKASEESSTIDIKFNVMYYNVYENMTVSMVNVTGNQHFGNNTFNIFLTGGICVAVIFILVSCAILMYRRKKNQTAKKQIYNRNKRPEMISLDELWTSAFIEESTF